MLRTRMFSLWVGIVFLGTMVIAPFGTGIAEEASGNSEEAWVIRPDPGDETSRGLFDRWYVSTYCDVSSSKGVWADLYVTDNYVKPDTLTANFVNLILDDENFVWLQCGWCKHPDTDYELSFYTEYHDGTNWPVSFYPDIDVTTGTHTFYIYASTSTQGVWYAVIDFEVVTTFDTRDWEWGPYSRAVRTDVEVESSDQGNEMYGWVDDMKYATQSPKKGIKWWDWSGFDDVTEDWPYYIFDFDGFTGWGYDTSYILLRDGFTGFDKGTTTWELDESGGTINADYSYYYPVSPSLKLERSGTTGGVMARHHFDCTWGGEQVGTSYDFYGTVAVRVSNYNICYVLFEDDQGHVRVYFALQGGYFKWYDGTWHTATGWTYNTNTWYVLMFGVHPDTKEYTVSAAGHLEYCDMYQVPDDDDPIMSIRLQAGWYDVSSPVEFWVDMIDIDADV